MVIFIYFIFLIEKLPLAKGVSIYALDLKYLIFYPCNISYFCIIDPY